MGQITVNSGDVTRVISDSKATVAKYEAAGFKKAKASKPPSEDSQSGKSADTKEG